MIHKLQLAAVSIDGLAGIPESMAENTFGAEKAEKLVDVGWVVDADRKFDMTAMTGTAIPLVKVACGTTIEVRSSRLRTRGSLQFIFEGTKGWVMKSTWIWVQ
jgi:hypothetical protein